MRRDARWRSALTTRAAAGAPGRLVSRHDRPAGAPVHAWLARHRIRERTRPLVLLVAATVWVTAYRVLEATDLSALAALQLVIGNAVMCLVGLVGWNHRPRSRIGPLLTLYALTGLVGSFQLSSSTLPFTVGFAITALPAVILGHLVLAYPSGRLQTRLDRAVIAFNYAVSAPVAGILLMVYDPAQHAVGINDCRPGDTPGCPSSALLVHADTGLYDAVHTMQDLVYLVTSLAVMGLLVRRVWRATPRLRRMLLPLLVIGLPVTSGIVADSLLENHSRTTDQTMFWAAVYAQAALAATVLAGALQSRLAHAGVGRLVADLRHTPPGAVQPAIARALGDPSLQVVLWLADRGEYVDVQGAALPLPAADRRRAATVVERDGRPVAALIHDRGLLEQAGLVEEAASAALFALENAQLQAKVRTQLDELAESGTRVIAAADAERRRVERDIHDGAQQRLLALALDLRVAQRSLGAGGHDDIDRLLGAAVAELQTAVGELRELARGVYPALLTEEGLPAALESLATRTPLDVTLTAVPRQRLAPEIEATAYFVVCEALSNTVKHARATRVSIALRHQHGRLSVAVGDNGIGGARPNDGSGLRGLSDRLQVHGGRLRVDSAPGRGTALLAQIPCPP